MIMNNDDDNMRWYWEDILKDTQLAPSVSVLQKLLQTPKDPCWGSFMEVPCPPAWLSVSCKCTLELWQWQLVSPRAIKMLVLDEAHPEVQHVSNTNFVKFPGKIKGDMKHWNKG